jgi:ABC-2 type transport system permease protein
MTTQDSGFDSASRHLSRPTIGAVNWLGLWTLSAKEVRRFMKIPGQTVLAPTMTTLVFLAIFSLALGGAVRTVGDIPFMEFLAPGLIMMAIVQNSFANTSSSMMIGKVQGNIVDILIPPLSPAELTLSFVVGGVVRGLIVGLGVGMAMSFFVPLGIHSIWALLFYPVAASFLLSMIGLAAAIWADKFDQMAAITNFVITPLSFLSGTFYSIDRLPEPWHAMSLANPFFYLIDGMRYALIGRADGSLLVGVIVLCALNLALWGLCHQMIARGYKIKE